MIDYFKWLIHTYLYLCKKIFFQINQCRIFKDSNDKTFETHLVSSYYHDVGISI